MLFRKGKTNMSRAYAPALIALLIAAGTLPASAAESFPQTTVTGELFTNYSWQTTEKGPLNSGNDTGFNSFDLTRSFINVNSRLSSDYSLRFTTTLARGTDGEAQVVMLFAYQEAAMLGGRLRMGLLPTMFLVHEGPQWSYRSQGDFLYGRLGWTGASDLGLHYFSKFSDLSYDLFLLNGNGRKKENNESKLTQARLMYSPSQLKGVDLAVLYQGLNAGTVTGQRIVEGSATYRDNKVNLGASHAFTRDAAFTEGNASSLWATVTPFDPKFDGIVRWIHVKPSLANTTGEKNTYVVGIGYKPINGVHVLLDTECNVYTDTTKPLENVVGLHTRYAF